jgi:hypothetical protein
MWKLARGAVIAKLGKDDYSKVKSYRVICLLSCIGKCLECIIADGINAQLEANGGLHWGQFGGRKQRSAVDAVAYVMNRTHIAWNHGQIAGLLLMDVKGAFDHVNHRRLLTTMVAKKLDGDLIEWTEDFLTNRTVQTTVDVFDGEVSQINTGIPQGSPVSPILFASYLSCLFPLSPENVRKIQVAAVQAVSLYGAELWWDETKNHSRTTDRQKLVNRQSRSITGMLRTTPIGPLVNEAGLRSADSLLANRQRRYATRAFELPHGNPIGDGVRNPLHPVSLFAKLSQCATQDIHPQFSGQDVV